MTTAAQHAARRASVAILRSAGLSHREIAAELGVSLPTVQRDLDRPGLTIDPTAIAAHVAAGPAEPPRRWRDEALCRDEDPELFFPNPGEVLRLAEARGVCVRCPVIQACGNWATTAGIADGVFGGLTEDERRTMRRARNRTRARAAARGSP